MEKLISIVSWCLTSNAVLYYYDQPVRVIELNSFIYYFAWVVCFSYVSVFQWSDRKTSPGWPYNRGRSEVKGHIWFQPWLSCNWFGHISSIRHLHSRTRTQMPLLFRAVQELMMMMTMTPTTLMVMMMTRELFYLQAAELNFYFYIFKFVYWLHFICCKTFSWV